MFSHVELNVRDLDRSIRFYLSALAPLGFRMADGVEGQYARISNSRDAVIVLCAVDEVHRRHTYHRKSVGLGHVALAVATREAVDQMAMHLAGLGIPLLGEGSVETHYRHGYYTLAFEDPDRIMIEIVHHDPFYFALAPA